MKKIDPLEQPTKEQIREWLNTRYGQRAPFPSIEQIQRDVGWKVAPRPQSVSQLTYQVLQNPGN